MPPKVVSFWSYSDGFTSTYLTMSTAKALTDEGYKVLVLDMNLNSPGLQLPNLNTTPGLVDLFNNALEEQEKPDLFELADLTSKYSFTIDRLSKGDQTRNITIMPAGAIEFGNKKYEFNLTELDIAALYKEGLGQGLFLVLKARLLELGFDYILVNSSPGYSDEAGVCCRDLADLVVVIDSDLDKPYQDRFLDALKKLDRDVITLNYGYEAKVELSDLGAMETKITYCPELIIRHFVEKQFKSSFDQTLERQ